MSTVRYFLDQQKLTKKEMKKVWPGWSFTILINFYFFLFALIAFTRSESFSTFRFAGTKLSPKNLESL